MGILLIILLVLGAGLVILFSVLLVRAARLVSKQVQVDPVTDIPVDGQGAAARLARAIQFRTVSHQDAAQLDGEAFIGLHKYLEQAFPRVHATLTREVIGDYSLLYTWEGREGGLKPMLLMSHLDVVPVEPGTEVDWTYPPFEGRIAEGYVWGRGAMDVKVGVLGILEAAEMLLGEGFQPRRTIHFAFGHDEEVGGLRGAARIAERLHSRGVEPAYVLDEGGGVVVGVMPMISDPVAMVAIAEKGYLSVELTAQTEGGHSAVPPQHTAVGILSTAIHRLERNQFPTRWAGPVRQMFDHLAPKMPFGMRMVLANLWLFGGVVKRLLAASSITNALVRTTSAATIFEGGVKENVLPTYARAVVNFRILPGDRIDGVVEHVRRVVDDPRVEIGLLGTIKTDPSPISDISGVWFEILRRTIRQVFAGAAVAPGLVIGATDARHYAKLSNNVYRFSPLRVGREDLTRAHGTDERVSVENYEEAVRFYAQLVRNSAS